MAIKKQYAILDAVASVFLNPVTFANDAEAIRWFTTTVNDPKKETMISLHPQGYTLYRLADYDDLTGRYQPRDVNSSGDPSQEPKQIITAINVVNKEEKLTLEEIRTMIKELQYDTSNVTKIN